MLPLNESQLRTLTCAVDRIVPADDFPSASQAGCVEFLLRLIRWENLGDFYYHGICGLDAEAALHESRFCDLAVHVQDEILSLCSKGKTNATWAVSARQFVDLLASQTIEGYYSDPGNGGNRGEVSWRMVGFEVRG